MTKYDPLWQKINNVLRMVDQMEVVKRIDEYYLDRYGNSAPGKCFKRETEELQKMLDEAREMGYSDDRGG